MNNYYDEIIENIKNNVDKNPEQALILIQNELSMPYIPSDIEKKLINLKAKAKSYINKTPEKLISKDVFLKMFKSNNHDDRITALTFLQDLNANNFLDEFKEFFKNEQIMNDEKTMLLILLKEQKIDYDFNIVKNNLNGLINPKNFNIVIYANLFKSCQFIYDKLCDDKNISQENLFREILMLFINDLIPFKINFGEWELVVATLMTLNEMFSYTNKYIEIIDLYDLDKKQINIITELQKKLLKNKGEK